MVLLSSYIFAYYGIQYTTEDKDECGYGIEDVMFCWRVSCAKFDTFEVSLQRRFWQQLVSQIV